jgi:hypothetical protein
MVGLFNNQSCNKACQETMQQYCSMRAAPGAAAFFCTSSYFFAVKKALIFFEPAACLAILAAAAAARVSSAFLRAASLGSMNWLQSMQQRQQQPQKLVRSKLWMVAAGGMLKEKQD